MGLKARAVKGHGRGAARLAALLCALFLVVASPMAPSSSLAGETAAANAPDAAGLPQPLAASAQPIKAVSFKMAGDATKMRIVVDFDRAPDPKWFLLRGPNRLVIDLPGTLLRFHPDDLKARGLVRNVRYGAIADGASRLVIAGKGPFLVEKLDVLANEDGSG